MTTYRARSYCSTSGLSGAVRASQSFPHLRDWHEKYADQGLTIVGLTRYFEYDWNDADKRPSQWPARRTQPSGRCSSKFAEHHGLKHRIGIQGANDVSDFYRVTGIPHVVVIDRQGKIRMMRVGSRRQDCQGHRRPACQAARREGGRRRVALLENGAATVDNVTVSGGAASIVFNAEARGAETQRSEGVKHEGHTTEQKKCRWVQWIVLCALRGLRVSTASLQTSAPLRLCVIPSRRPIPFRTPLT